MFYCINKIGVPCDRDYSLLMYWYTGDDSGGAVEQQVESGTLWPCGTYGRTIMASTDYPIEIRAIWPVEVSCWNTQHVLDLFQIELDKHRSLDKNSSELGNEHFGMHVNIFRSWMRVLEQNFTIPLQFPPICISYMHNFLN